MFQIIFFKFHYFFIIHAQFLGITFHTSMELITVLQQKWHYSQVEMISSDEKRLSQPGGKLTINRTGCTDRKEWIWSERMTWTTESRYTYTIRRRSRPLSNSSTRPGSESTPHCQAYVLRAGDNHTKAVLDFVNRWLSKSLIHVGSMVIPSTSTGIQNITIILIPQRFV